MTEFFLVALFAICYEYLTNQVGVAETNTHTRAHMDIITIATAAALLWVALSH